MIRLQDKGNRFALVNKETNKVKAQQQIAKSSFQELDYDPTKEHIKRVEHWSEKRFGKKKIRKNGKSIFLITMHNLVRILLFRSLISLTYTAQKMKFSIKDFSCKCDQIRSFLRIWSHLLENSLMENFIFCPVKPVRLLTTGCNTAIGN